MILPPCPFPLPRPCHPQISCGCCSSHNEVRREGLGWTLLGCRMLELMGMTRQEESALGEGTEPRFWVSSTFHAEAAGDSPKGMPCRQAGEGLGGRHVSSRGRGASSPRQLCTCVSML